MNDIEILERLENMQETFIEEGLQGYEMVIVNTKNLINNLIVRNKELEEKNKELENADLTSVYLDGVYDGEKKWKDKIKEKIKELEKLKLCSDNFYKLITEDKIKLLQELLEQ